MSRQVGATLLAIGFDGSPVVLSVRIEALLLARLRGAVRAPSPMSTVVAPRSPRWPSTSG